ncbi:response regulator [Niastella sp. OAS944]|uniref:response regulator n=1 Tax=Niastella sp. OAS944 TaxID=2664089 RepID=UPI00346EE0AA|nr:CheY-like chemotaxis protein [Chitinophagaceae bacterium OAS944]
MTFPKKVFLIDDDDEEYEIFNSALNECNADIQLIYEKNANTALDRMAADNADAIAEMIFLDWRMPKVSGKEVLISIRKLPLYSQVPIIIFTGNLDPLHLNEAKELGATFLMQKPFDLSDLYDKLKYLFSLDWRYIKPNDQQI